MTRDLPPIVLLGIVWGVSAALVTGFVAVGIARRIEHVITGDRLPERR